MEIAQEAAEHGYAICCGATRKLFCEMIAESASEMIKDPETERIQSTLALIEISEKLCKDGPVDRAQELVYEARRLIPESPERARLISALHLAPSIFETTEEQPEEPEEPGETEDTRETSEAVP